jgi:hypothetical protein
MNRPNSATTQPTLLRTGQCGGGGECLYGAGSTKGALVRSLGRTGVSWDSAVAELFWGTANVEFYDPALVADQSGGSARRRRLDRAGLQPMQTPLRDRRDQPRQGN